MITGRVPCSTDAECIALFLKGDDRCFAELVKHHRPEILHYIYTYTHNWQHSKDIFQDVIIDFVMLLRSGKYVEQGKVHHLLINMAHKRVNECLRQRRNHNIFLPLSEEDKELHAESKEEEWQPTRSELLRLHAYIRTMKEKRRALFMKRYHGKSYQEISRNIGISPAAAKAEFSRMVKKLRKFLNKKK